MIAADGGEGDTTFARRRHARRHRLGKGAEERVQHSEADDRASIARTGKFRVHNRAERCDDLDWSGEALKIRDLLLGEALDREVCG